MKKINLRGVEETLSEREMKKVVGGNCPPGCYFNGAGCVCDGGDLGNMSVNVVCFYGEQVHPYTVYLQDIMNVCSTYGEIECYFEAFGGNRIC